ncbi:AMP-dependent synthetase and ligase [Nostocoides japonicum T1-X7]|uniref:AMP-dependent synthetase and ligase n=1 Tax=Nostocoides japonicum T1-X7 TaxID=1194083 RepID=A0A077M8T5_9MICO|nr:AMP-binding protein [Tetrasphaera japonica]CCH80444.1 AMP-dependent synthetase and ligase [Tetrasphaera japonica T1-X7]
MSDDPVPPSSPTDATTAYRQARDELLALRGRQEEAVRTFTWPDVGNRFNWAVDWFDAVARGNDRDALIVVEEDGTSTEVSFDAMAARSDRVAAWLAGQGVRRGDPVIIMLGNQVELWDVMLAVIKLGAVIMPTTTAARSTDLEDRFRRGGAKHVVVNAADTDRFDDVAGDYTRMSIGEAEGWANLDAAYAVDVPPSPHPGTSPTDPLLLYFTSGTTSRPKLVEHTQVSYPVGHLSTMYWLGLQPGDVHLNISSPGWAKHAWSCFFAPWIAEATIMVYNYKRFDAGALLGQLRDRDVTSFCAPPTVWRMLIQADLSGGPGSLREVVGAGEPLNPEIIEQVDRAWGLTLRDGYGQTEMTAAVGNAPGSPVKPGSMGRPLPGYPVVIADPLTGERTDPWTVAEGTHEGEICLDLAGHPLPLMTGYQQDEERNAEAMEGGLYHTGDVASVDTDGYVTYIGRTDDVFKASDYKISPFELESVLIEHPAVREAAVVPAPDPVRLAVPKAYIDLADGFEPSEETARSILAYAREHLSPWQRVRRVEFAELPKTISGKIRRVELRGREEELAAGADRGEGREWRDDDFPDLRGS